MTDLSTLTRRQPEADAEKQPERKGVWREVYWIAPLIKVNYGLFSLGGCHWASSIGHATREEAEAFGRASQQQCFDAGSPFDAGVELIEARFFPEDGGPE